MDMASAGIDTFSQVVNNPRSWLKQWKQKTGRKVIGGFPMYLPEEVIHACGALPSALLGEDEPVSLAQQYLHTYLCHPVQGNFDLALKGKLDYLDGIVFADICDQSKRLASLWKFYHHLPFYHHLLLPKRLDSAASLDLLIYEFKRLGRAVSGFTGVELNEEDLSRSISLHNRTRGLLHQLDELRREKPNLFAPSEVPTIIGAAMLMPKEDFNPLLNRYLEAKGREPSLDGDKVRLVLWGNPCEDIEPGFMEILDEVGGVAVADDLFLGSRYFSTLVPESGAPWSSLALAHLSTPACPTRYDSRKDWADALLQVVKRSRAKGVILLLQKFCEIHSFDYPWVKSRLSEAQIPLLAIETDHSGAGARVKTRLEAFIEMVRES